MCPVVGIVGWTGLSLSLSLSALSLSLSLCPSFLCLDFCLCLSHPLSLYLALLRFLYLAAYSNIVGADPAADYNSLEVCGLAPGFPHCLERRWDVGE